MRGCSLVTNLPIVIAMDPVTTNLIHAQRDSTRFAISMKVLSKAKTVQEEEGRAIVDMIAAAKLSDEVRTPSGRIDTYA